MNSPKITQTYLYFFMSISPFATGYKEPSAQNNYFKMKDEGSYLIRILTNKDEAIVYWSDFVENSSGKTEKKTYPFQNDGQKPTEASDKAKINWAFVIFNKDTQQVQVWEVSQKSIKNFLKSIVEGKIKNDYTKFDIQITKTGKGMETEYSLLTGDTEPLTKEELKIINETKVNLKAMEKGGNPFDTNLPEIDDQEVEEIIEKMETEQHPDTFTATPF